MDAHGKCDDAAGQGVDVFVHDGEHRCLWLTRVYHRGPHGVQESSHNLIPTVRAIDPPHARLTDCDRP